MFDTVAKPDENTVLHKKKILKNTDVLRSTCHPPFYSRSKICTATSTMNHMCIKTKIGQLMVLTVLVATFFLSHDVTIVPLHRLYYIVDTVCGDAVLHLHQILVDVINLLEL